MISALLLSMLTLSGGASGDSLDARLEETHQLIATLEAREATAREILNAIHDHLEIARDYYNELALRETEVVQTLQYISERYFYEDSLRADLERGLAAYVTYVYSHRRLTSRGSVFGSEGLSRVLHRNAYLGYLASRAAEQYGRLSTSSDSLAQYRDSLETLRDDIRALRERMEEMQTSIYAEEARQMALRLQLESEIEIAQEEALEMEQRRRQVSSFVSGLTTSSGSSYDGSLIFRVNPSADSYLERERGMVHWPCHGEIVRRFGVETDPDYGTETVCDGVRIATSSSSAVNSVGPGVVMFAGSYMYRDGMVIIDHQDGYYTIYEYLDDVSVTQGQTIEEGQNLGTCGTIPEGRSGYMLEVRRAGSPVDPVTYMESM
jgi:septal ring factor EnvC (AmiA/AmiB activator)